MLKNLRARILSILIDRKDHSTSEIVSRVRHTIDPAFAVRAIAKKVNGLRVSNRTRRNKTGKILHSLRKPDVDPGSVNINEAIRQVIVNSLKSCKRENIVDSVEEPGEEGYWQINNAGVEHCKNHSGAIALELRRNIKSLGKLF